MNREAERHLTKAAGYLERGDEFYAKAADEIIAAMEADPTLGQREIGERFGKGHKWVSTIVTWRTSGSPESQPIDWKRGSHATTKEIEVGAERLLAEAPMEQIERIVSSLPRERQQAIGAAAGDAYLGRRQEFEEHERRLTPAERDAREKSSEKINQLVGVAMSGFTTLDIVDHLEAATEALREMSANASLVPEVLRRIEQADNEWHEALDFARALLGEEA